MSPESRAAQVTRALHGHRWTLLPFISRALRPVAPPVAEHFRVMVPDPDVGSVRLTGRLRRTAGRRTLILLVHGLGGKASSGYMVDAACAAEAAGCDSLRLNLRGADRAGGDFYHAGLTADLHAVIGSSELADYETIGVIGFSLGGHTVLRFATEDVDSRVRAVAGVCSPLDLDRCAHAIDARERSVYLWHVLSGLKEMYRSVARTREVPLPPNEADKIRTIREWDGRVVAPRYGFASAEDYYARMNVAQVIDKIRIPALVAHALHDPMVPAETVRSVLERASAKVTTRWIDDGGHLGFPRTARALEGMAGGVEDQIIAWVADEQRSAAAPGRTRGPGARAPRSATPRPS